jgi:cysteine-rich repeat protein
MSVSKNWSVKAGLCLIASVVAFSGCGDDEDRVPSGSSAGKAGSGGGSSIAGKTGSPGGGSSGDQGGMNEPGGAPAGGMQTSMGGGGGDAGEAGAAGAGMSGPKCGDGNKDAGEECDDGNTTNGDGCSSKCTSKCEVCEKAHCTFSSFPEAYNTVDELCFKAVPGDVALDGPAKGAPRSKLCTDLVECVRTTKCVADLTPALLTFSAMQTCYCGVDANGGAIDCVMAGVDAKGPCVKEFQRAAESEDNSSVASRLFEPLDVDSLGLAIGRATVVAQNCDLNACANECYFGTESDACSRCTLGESAHEAFDPSMATCGTPAVTCGASEGCSAVVACARQTKCAATNVADCYADGAGPCATQIKTASGLTDVAAIKAAMDPSKATDLGYAVSLIGCMKSSCNAQCFP